MGGDDDDAGIDGVASIKAIEYNIRGKWASWTRRRAWEQVWKEIQLFLFSATEIKCEW